MTVVVNLSLLYCLVLSFILLILMTSTTPKRLNLLLLYHFLLT